MGKIFTVTLPDIGEGVVEGEVIEWYKNIGDRLAQDEPVVVVMTDKATVELPAPYAGRLLRQYFQPGQISIKGRPLYDIELDQASMPADMKAEALPVSAPDALPQPRSVHMPPVANVNAPPAVPKERSTPSQVKATPPVRALARQMGIDLSTLQGSGKEGRIERRDLMKIPSTKDEVLHLPEDKIEPLIGIHNLMAKKMVESKEHIPHFSYFEQVEVDRLAQLRESSQRLAEGVGVHLTYMPFFIRALSMCINKYPWLNSCFDAAANALVVHASHNIGIAMDTRRGLIVPVLKDVQAMGFEQIVHAYDDLHHRALQNKLLPAEMREGTISISNFGLVSSMDTWATPVINYPEVAILALSRIHAQPVAKNDAVVVKQVINLSWSFDHRVIDGAMAVRISHDFCSYVRDPAILI